MLLRFAVANHRSVMEPIELSMIALDTDRPSVRSFARFNEGVLPVAAIYGANASGKSNILDALIWLSVAVDGSFRFWDQIIPRDPFKFSKGATLSSTYEIDMLVGGIRYSYTVELNSEKVISETLTSYPEKKPRVILERDGLDVSLRRGIGGATVINELVTSTNLALSAAMRFGINEVEPFARELAALGALGIRSVRHRDPKYAASPYRRQPRMTERLFSGARGGDDQPTLFDGLGIEPPRTSDYQAALELLKHADLGIDDVEIVEEGVVGDARTLRRLVRLVHRVDDQRVPFDMIDESEGTQTWFRLIGPVIQAIKNGQVLLVDELDASLHPRLSAVLIALFQDPLSNPRNAQLVFTTHDTSLLNHLNRDEVWLTEKTHAGSTRLTALADYGGEKVRRSLNLEKAYLQGRFGGVPEADQVVLRRALGLLTGIE
jgi:uncharacterized protein